MNDIIIHPDIINPYSAGKGPLKDDAFIRDHGGIEKISDIRTITEPLFSEIYKKMDFPFRILRPFTRLSSEVKNNHFIQL